MIHYWNSFSPVLLGSILSKLNSKSIGTLQGIRISITITSNVIQEGLTYSELLNNFALKLYSFSNCLHNEASLSTYDTKSSSLVHADHIFHQNYVISKCHIWILTFSFANSVAEWSMAGGISTKYLSEVNSSNILKYIPQLGHCIPLFQGSLFSGMQCTVIGSTTSLAKWGGGQLPLPIMLSLSFVGTFGNLSVHVKIPQKNLSSLARTYKFCQC